MKIKALLVDDEPLAIKVLKEYLMLMPDIQVISECNDAVQALQIMEKRQIDLLFLDINMPKLNGLQLKKQLDKSILTVFTTAHTEYAIDAFEVDAVDYLIKPFSFERFLLTISRVKKLLNRKNQVKSFLTIKENKRIYKIDIENIYYFQAYGDYVRVFSKDKTYLTKEKLMKIEQTLPANFIRVHRSFIINLDEIKYLEGNHVVINGEKIPISHKHKSTLLSRL